MVERKLNKPTYKICNMPIFWLHEVVGSGWRCHNCKAQQEKRTVAFELWLRGARKNVPKNIESKPDEHWRAYLCLQCASTALETSLDKVNIVKAHGVKGFNMFEEL